MSRRDRAVVLRHMLDHAVEAMALSAGRTRTDLENDRMFQLAILHLVQIVGEAANRMPAEEQSALPEIPWADIIGFRHRVAHGYDQVNLDIVWRVCKVELPALVATIRALLEKGIE